MTPGPGIEPGPHWWEASALTTAPSLLPLVAVPWEALISALDSGACGLGSSPGRGHCALFLGKTLYSGFASLHPGV